MTLTEGVGSLAVKDCLLDRAASRFDIAFASSDCMVVKVFPVNRIVVMRLTQSE